MDYEEAKVLIPSGAFKSCYARVSDSKEIFQKLIDEGPDKNATKTFEEIKNAKAAFTDGPTKNYYDLVNNYEQDLRKVYNKAIYYLDIAKGHCISILNGMSVDCDALVAAEAEELRVFNSLAPHKRPIYDDKGEQIGEEDLEAEHRATALAAARAVWKAECCQWSK